MLSALFKENVVTSSMSFVVIIILLLLACATYGIFKTISHPAFITSFLWFCILLIYQTVDHGLYALSDKLYGVLLLWNIGFCFSSLAICYVRFPIFVNWRYERYNSAMKVLLPIFIISLLIAIYGLYIKGNYYNSDNIFRGIRESSVLAMEGEDDFQYPMYVTFAMAVVGQSVAVLISLLYVGKKKNLFVIIYACLVLLFFVMRSNKYAMAQLLLAFLAISSYNNTLYKRKFFVYLVCFLGLMLTVHLLRAGDGYEFDFVKFISVYFLAPLPAFDNVLNTHIDYISDFHGEYTLRFIIPFLQTLGFSVEGNPDPFNLHNWTYTPLPVNVYTIMFSYYVDWGYWGIIVFSILLGTFWGGIWKGMEKGYKVALVIYSSFFYMLVFQFFADFFFQYFWVTFQTILFALFLFFSKNTCKNRI